jgi:hypothetical protein
VRWTKSTRVLVGVIGVVVALAGLLWWTLEAEYGSGLNFEVVGAGDAATVYEVDETAGARRSVFEGTEEEALAYIERRQGEGENLLFPGLVVGAGALLILMALIPARRSEAAAE